MHSSFEVNECILRKQDSQITKWQDLCEYADQCVESTEEDMRLIISWIVLVEMRSICRVCYVRAN